MHLAYAIIASLLVLVSDSTRAEPPPCSAEDPRPATNGIQLRFEPASSADDRECLDAPDSRRHLAAVAKALSSRWKVPVGIDPFPSVVADFEFERDGKAKLRRIDEATDRELADCAKHAVAQLSVVAEPPTCLVGKPVRVRLVIPWSGADGVY
jgi:hypothetical protein